MKLADLWEETIWEGKIDGKHYTATVINEIMSVYPSKGGILSKSLRTGAASITANPWLAALGAGLAIASYSAYTRNKRNTMRLFAKNYEEKRKYQKIVDDMMKSGYKKVKEKQTGGGWLWELKRR